MWRLLLPRHHTILSFVAVIAGTLVQQGQPAGTASRPPTIELAQPASGGTVPQDRPIIAFRFATGDSTDALDLSSLRVGVDGRERTAEFRIMPNEAWGTVAPAAGGGALLALGSHTVTARICTLRGICAATAATVEVTTACPGVPARPPGEGHGLLASLWRLLRKLIGR